MRSSLLFYCRCPHFAIAPISQKSEIGKFQKVDPHFLPRFLHGSNQNFFIIIYQNSVLAGDPYLRFRTVEAARLITKSKNHRIPSVALHLERVTRLELAITPHQNSVLAGTPTSDFERWR